MVAMDGRRETVGVIVVVSWLVALVVVAAARLRRVVARGARDLIEQSGERRRLGRLDETSTEHAYEDGRRRTRLAVSRISPASGSRIFAPPARAARAARATTRPSTGAAPSESRPPG